MLNSQVSKQTSLPCWFHSSRATHRQTRGICHKADLQGCRRMCCKAAECVRSPWKMWYWLFKMSNVPLQPYASQPHLPSLAGKCFSCDFDWSLKWERCPPAAVTHADRLCRLPARRATHFLDLKSRKWNRSVYFYDLMTWRLAYMNDNLTKTFHLKTENRCVHFEGHVQFVTVHHWQWLLLSTRGSWGVSIYSDTQHPVTLWPWDVKDTHQKVYFNV